MPTNKVERIKQALDEGRGVREAARLLKVSAAKVSEIRRATIGSGTAACTARPDAVIEQRK
jgi:hypothetical protein